MKTMYELLMSVIKTNKSIGELIFYARATGQITEIEKNSLLEELTRN